MAAPLSKKIEWSFANSIWASTLNPIITRPQNNSLILKNITLRAGVNIINHTLNKVPDGWSIVDRDAAATIYRSAPLNSLTLVLTASAPVTISLEVF